MGAVIRADSHDFVVTAVANEPLVPSDRSELPASGKAISSLRHRSVEQCDLRATVEPGSNRINLPRRVE